MKTIYKSLIMLAVAAMAMGCQQKEFRKVYPAGDPQVEAQLLTTDVQYGKDSIAFSVRVTETQTPLSALSIKVVAGTNVLANEVVRTPIMHLRAVIATPYLSEPIWQRASR